MKNLYLRALGLALVSLNLCAGSPVSASDEATPASELIGLWKATKHLGPEVRGPLTIEVQQGKWKAQIASFSVVAEAHENEVRFELPEERGRFVGIFDEARESIRGHWIQPPPVQIGLRVASPIHFRKIGPDRWQGEVIPRDSEFTFFLVVQERDDGTVGVFLRNPDRNLGLFRNLDRVVRRGNDLEFIGTFFRNRIEEVQLRGRYDPDNDRFSVFFSPGRGGTYDFERIDEDEFSGFYARQRNPGPWIYHPPPEEDDGWETASLQEVGISVGPIKSMIEKEIDPPADSVNTPYVHGVLIGRHGKLVLEEYFHGFHRHQPHDTRSASKSLTSLLTGAAIQAGTLENPSILVYPTIYGEELPANVDPRKTRMTLEHLLTMSSGFYCDDSDYQAPGNEDIMQEQEEEPNWYRYTLDLPMATEPGEVSVYCSVNSNLIGNVLMAASGRGLPDLFETLIAEPLDVQRYYFGPAAHRRALHGGRNPLAAPGFHEARPSRPQWRHLERQANRQRRMGALLDLTAP